LAKTIYARALIYNFTAICILIILVDEVLPLKALAANALRKKARRAFNPFTAAKETFMQQANMTWCMQMPLNGSAEKTHSKRAAFKLLRDRKLLNAAHYSYSMLAAAAVRVH
jgi:hypothetical protein